MIVRSLPAEPECVHYLSIVGSLLQMAELLCVRDQSWLLCRGWPNCCACTIDCDFVDVDGRAALRARSIVGLLPQMAEFGCAIIEDCGSEVCVRDPKIIAQKLGSEVCAGKSSDGPNPYFAHSIYTYAHHCA